ncbi:MAG: DUF4340 domain-containing protein [Bacteroidales bacterium]|nr:DUF4340 domain-containing protein [Bacteroidales bacterium]
MKKNRTIIIVAILLILLCLVLILFKNGVFTADSEKMPEANAMALSDSSNVTQIFIADMHENTVLLKKRNGMWMLHDTIPAIQYNVKSILGTLTNLTIRQSVPNTGVSTINELLAVGATKVEIYENAPKFTLFGIPFFVKERKTKTYYFGPATQDNISSYAYLEGMNEPYIVHIPGFRGFVTPQFSAFEKDWMSHILFNTKITRIQSVEFLDLENPDETFIVEKAGARFFNIYDRNHQQIMQYDTSRLLDMLSEFREKNFQNTVNDLEPALKDSILTHNMFRVIKLTDINGQVTELRFYRLSETVKKMTKPGDLIQEIQHEYSVDKFYATLADKPNELYVVQYFHFDRQLQPLSYFLLN